MKELSERDKELITKKLASFGGSRIWTQLCPVCNKAHVDYKVNTALFQSDKQSFIQIFCSDCGHSVLLNYNVFMKNIEEEYGD